jgi:hypothetical protein
VDCDEYSDLPELPLISDVEVVMAFLQKRSASPINRRDAPCLRLKRKKPRFAELDCAE